MELYGNGSSEMRRDRSVRPRGRPGAGSRSRVSPGGPGAMERSWVETAVSGRPGCHCGDSMVVTVWEEGSRGWEPVCTSCGGCGCCRYHWDGLIPVEVSQAD